MLRRGLAMLAVVACTGLGAAAPAAALVGTGVLGDDKVTLTIEK